MGERFWAGIIYIYMCVCMCVWLKGGGIKFSGLYLRLVRGEDIVNQREKEGKCDVNIFGRPGGIFN